MICRTKILTDEEGQKPTCRSPMACKAFGYCRERNFNFGVPFDIKTIEEWKKEDNQ